MNVLSHWAQVKVACSMTIVLYFCELIYWVFVLYLSLWCLLSMSVVYFIKESVYTWQRNYWPKISCEFLINHRSLSVSRRQRWSFQATCLMVRVLAGPLPPPPAASTLKASLSKQVRAQRGQWVTGSDLPRPSCRHLRDPSPGSPKPLKTLPRRSGNFKGFSLCIDLFCIFSDVTPLNLLKLFFELCLSGNSR